MFELILQYVFVGIFVYKFIELRSVQVGTFRLEFGKPRIDLAEPEKPQIKSGRAKKQIEK